MSKTDILRELLAASDDDFEKIVKQAIEDRKKLAATRIDPEDWLTLCRMYKVACTPMTASRNFEVKGTIELTIEMTDSCEPDVEYHISHLDCDSSLASMFISGDRDAVIKKIFHEEIRSMQFAADNLFRAIEGFASTAAPDPKDVKSIEADIWNKLNDKFFYRENGILKKHKDQW